METQPWLTIEDVENRLRALLGAFHANEAWSAEKAGEQAVTQGHRALKKPIIIFTRFVEASRHPLSEHGRAFTLQALKASFEAARCNGNWSLASPVLGLQDPDSSTPSLIAPAENVALLCYSKERELLEEMVEKANKGDSP